MYYQFFLKVFNFLPQMLENQEIVINCRIYKAISEIIYSIFSKARKKTNFLVYFLRDRNANFPFLKRKNVIVT